MIDVKANAQTTLKNWTALVTLLKGKHIHTDHTKNANQYPRIVLFEISIVDTDYMDDEPTAYEATLQVSIYSKEPTLAIFIEVDKAMKAAGWTRTYGNEVYEEDTGIYHRPCRYKNKFQYE